MTPRRTGFSISWPQRGINGFSASSFFPARLWRFALAGLALSGCAQTHQTTAALEPPRSPYSDADAWHRQTLLDCLCQSMGTDWVTNFGTGHGKLFLYVAVDQTGQFRAIEHFYSSLDSARLAASRFLPLYKARLAAPDAPWPAPQGVTQNTFDTLRLGNHTWLVRHFTIPLFCRAEKPCNCR